MTFDRHPRVWAVALVALLLGGLGLWMMLGAGGDVSRRHTTVTGVPLDEVHPSGIAPGERRPGVVVAHGFAGSAKLMAPFGDSLAARGFVVVLLDFDGHGSSERRLSDGTDPDLGHDLDVALAHLRGLPDVDPARLSLVGHSMGATAVTRYAATHPEIAATVAISLPEASAIPRHLLVMPGALEFPDFHTEAERAEAQGAKMVVVPGVEHITVLFAPRTHRETAAWLGAESGDLPSPLRRVAGAVLLLIALAVGILPLARLLFGEPTGAWPRPEARSLTALAAAAVAAALATLLAPLARLPLELGGYLTGFAVAMAVLMLGYAQWRGPKPEPRRTKAIAVPILIAYAAVTIALPLQLGLTQVLPTGPRWWILAVVWAGFTALAYAAERLTGGNSIAVLAVSAIAVVALAGAAVVGLTSSFLILIVVLLAALLLWQALWSATLHRFGAPQWLIAPVGALIVAWPLAAALPIVS